MTEFSCSETGTSPAARRSGCQRHPSNRHGARHSRAPSRRWEATAGSSAHPKCAAPSAASAARLLPGTGIAPAPGASFRRHGWERTMSSGRAQRLRTMCFLRQAEIFSVSRHSLPPRVWAVPTFQSVIILIGAIFLSYPSQSTHVPLCCPFTFYPSYCFFRFRVLLLVFYFYFAFLFFFLAPMTLTSQLFSVFAVSSTLYLFCWC